MLSGQSIFSKNRTTPDFAPVEAYGMGWLLTSYKENVLYTHSSGINGYTANLAVYPDSELVIAHLANSDRAYLSLFSYYIADEIFGLPKTADWAEDAVNTSRSMFEARAGLMK
ncbi:hypothetical protein BGX27_005041, partial [Mortierella sp. AM989]